LPFFDTASTPIAAAYKLVRLNEFAMDRAARIGASAPVDFYKQLFKPVRYYASSDLAAPEHRREFCCRCALKNFAGKTV
jgi:hypothetical protein